jgi:60 kDa SS-A/Ro ribonucleoprotein
MAKYNQKSERVEVNQVKPVTTLQGGQGFSQKPESELIGILATGMGNNFYEKENEREKRFREVLGTVAKKNKLFAAKALIYARTVFGQRSVTHFGAVELLPYLQGDQLGKKFFTKRDKKAERGGIIWRLDDMAEILAAYIAKNGITVDDKWTLPNSIKKGFKDAIEHADTYELAKYQLKNRGVSLVDIVNLVHPVETSKNGNVFIPESEYLKAIKGTKFEKNGYTLDAKDSGKVGIPALRALVLGLLKQFNTVEDKNTESGKVVAEKVKSGEITQEQAVVELNEAKTENFKELIETKKIGYLALLRNIRNILKTNDTVLLDKACELLVNQDFIRKSLVWPHQIDLALEVMLIEFNGRQLQKISAALDEAYEKAIPNLKNLLPEGRTAVVFDTSGSMEGGWNGGLKIEGKPSNARPVDKAALIAATFAKGTGGDVYHFASTCSALRGWNPNDSINTLKRSFAGHIGENGHGTVYASILPELQRVGGGYDRVLIITDEQGADSFESTYNSYSQKYGTPYVYFINIVGYGPTMAKAGNKVFRLFGYSADIYEKIPKLEMNINEVIDAINRIEI